jgi:hypothetical protein
MHPTIICFLFLFLFCALCGGGVGSKPNITPPKNKAKNNEKFTKKEKRK